MKRTNNKSFLVPFAAAAIFLGACGTAASDSSELPVNHGAEPTTEQPILEPGDELVYGTDPIDLADA